MTDDRDAATDLHGFATYTTSHSPRDAVIDFLGDQADSYDVDGLTEAYRTAINEALSGTGISLAEADFYSAYPVPDDAAETIQAAIASVDLGDYAADYDRSEQG